MAPLALSALLSAAVAMLLLACDCEAAAAFTREAALLLTTGTCAAAAHPWSRWEVRRVRQRRRQAVLDGCRDPAAAVDLQMWQAGCAVCGAGDVELAVAYLVLLARVGDAQQDHRDSRTGQQDLSSA